MVTLLTAEMIAGAFQRDGAAIAGAAGFVGATGKTADATKTAELSNQITAAETKRNSAESVLSQKMSEPLPTADKTEGMSDQQAQDATDRLRLAHNLELDRLRANLNDAQREVQRAQLAYTASLDQSGGDAAAPIIRTTSSGGEYVGWSGSNALSAQQLVMLQSNYLQRDKGGAIVDTCITRMNNDFLFTKKDNVDDFNFPKLRSEIEVKQKELTNLQVKRNIALNDRRIDYEKKIASIDENDEIAIRNLDRIDDAETDRIRGEFDPAISLLSAEIDSRISEIDWVTSGKSSVQTEADRVCRELVQNFYNQLSTTQNARLELQLKALEADVQKQRYLADMKRADLCANVVGDMSKPPSEAAAKRAWEKLTSACIGLIEDKSLPVLGNLESLSGSDATLGSVAEEIFSRP